MFEILSGVPKPVSVVIALALVLALIGVIAWVVRRVAANRLGGGGMRGRQPRLAVIDAANVDARRKLILIRRDNIEHLLMIGGPSDIVVEPNIVRAGGARESMRENSRLDVGARAAADNGWPLQPATDPARVRDENWTAPEPVPARSRGSETLGGLSADLSSRLPEAAPRREPRTPSPAAPAPAETALDHNLAGMAEQLEAALRSSVAEPRATASVAAPKLGDVPGGARPAEPPRRDVKMRIDPRIERNEPRREVRPEPKLDRPELKLAPAPGEPKPEVKVEPRPEMRLASEPRIDAKLEGKPEPKPAPGSDAGPEQKPEPRIDMKPEPKLEAKPAALSRQDFYDNLEEEMASLLGRPPGKP